MNNAAISETLLIASSVRMFKILAERVYRDPVPGLEHGMYYRDGMPRCK